MESSRPSRPSLVTLEEKPQAPILVSRTSSSAISFQPFLWSSSIRLTMLFHALPLARQTIDKFAVRPLLPRSPSAILVPFRSCCLWVERRRILKSKLTDSPPCFLFFSSLPALHFHLHVFRLHTAGQTGHAEAVKVQFDASTVGYGELTEVRRRSLPSSSSFSFLRLGSSV